MGADEPLFLHWTPRTRLMGRGLGRREKKKKLSVNFSRPSMTSSIMRDVARKRDRCADMVDPCCILMSFEIEMSVENNKILSSMRVLVVADRLNGIWIVLMKDFSGFEF